MLPRIFEFEEGRIKITPEAYGIPEVHALIKKYEDDVEPYLAYVCAFSYPDSIYRNIPEAERSEAALFDIKETLGDFDEDDDLIDPAVQRLKSLWESPQTLLADELEEEIHRWRKFLKETPISSEGDGNKDRLTFLDRAEKISLTARNVRKVADEEASVKMKGANTMGEY